MVIIRERNDASDSDIKEISQLYAQLDVLFAEVAQAILRWSLKKEGIIFETKKTSVEEAKLALLKIDKVLKKLIIVDKRFKFDERILKERYRTELLECRSSLSRMQISLNVIWKTGKPSKNKIPFGDTTNYNFIFSCLTRYVKIANGRSDSINKKVLIFNQSNRDPNPLPMLIILTIPNWADRYS